MLQEWTTPQVTEINLSGLTASARWRLRHPEQMAGIVRAYDKAHRSERAAAQRQRYANDPEKQYKRVQESLRKQPAIRLLQVARARAKKRGIEFNLTAEDLLPLPTHCPVFGVQLIYNAKGFHPDAASLDRKDSLLGYIRGHVFVISRRANSVKSYGTAAEHRAIAAWMEKAGG